MRLDNCGVLDEKVSSFFPAKTQYCPMDIFHIQLPRYSLMITLDKLKTYCRCKKLLVNIIIQNQTLIYLIKKFLYNAFILLTKCRGVVNSNDKLSITQVNYYCKTCLILLMLHLPTINSNVYYLCLQPTGGLD